MSLVSTDWLEKNLSKVKIFDATWTMSKRSPKEEYLKEHIPGAIFFDLDEHSDKDNPLPHQMSNSDYWTRMLWSFGIENSDQIILYSSNSEIFSEYRLWFNLKYFGHDENKIKILEGGFSKWKKENKQITSELPKLKEVKNYKVKENKSWIIKKNQIEENIKKKKFILVDSRISDRFEGKIEEPRPGLKRGHIENAINIPFKDCVNLENNTLKNEDELKELFNKKNIKYNDEVVFYCGSGTSCAVNAFTWNKITGKSPQIYMGSWSEFGKK